MAKSRIIKDLANGSVDTMVALKRAKVLLAEFNNEHLINWINYELMGYPEDVTLPDYRITAGNLVGSYLKGSMASHMTWTNVSLPLGKMPDDLRKNLLSIQFRESVDALRQLSDESIKENGQLEKNIPADFFPIIAKYNNDPFMVITSAHIVIGSQCIRNIFATIENRLLDVLILLEKEFGTLDELDLDTSSKTKDEIDAIAEKIIVIVYNDNSMTIGNNNRIKGSTIATTVEEKA